MKFNWFLVALYFCLMAVLLYLGNWQARRADEKRVLLQQQALAGASDELELTGSSPDDMDALRYSGAAAYGRYDSKHQFLVDNQVSDGKAGYFVLTPFVLADTGKTVLVNRGWAPAGPDRSVLPEVEVNVEMVTLHGRINRFPSVGIKLEGAETPTEGWPSLVQVVDSGILAKKLGRPLFNFQLELAADAPDGFKREWQTVKFLTPEQHTAYAIQWYGLAVTLTVLFGIGLKRNFND
jgi:surfeit locus 1 family protein